MKRRQSNLYSPILAGIALSLTHEGCTLSPYRYSANFSNSGVQVKLTPELEQRMKNSLRAATDTSASASAESNIAGTSSTAGSSFCWAIYARASDASNETEGYNACALTGISSAVGVIAAGAELSIEALPAGTHTIELIQFVDPAQDCSSIASLNTWPNSHATSTGQWLRLIWSLEESARSDLYDSWLQYQTSMTYAPNVAGAVSSSTVHDVGLSQAFAIKAYRFGSFTVASESTIELDYNESTLEIVAPVCENSMSETESTEFMSSSGIFFEETETPVGEVTPTPSPTSTGGTGTCGSTANAGVVGTAPQFIGPINSSGTVVTDVTTSPILSWAAATVTDGTIVTYQIALGTTPTTYDLLCWTDIGVSLTWFSSNLPNNASLTRFAFVRAVDNAGNVSQEKSTSWNIMPNGGGGTTGGSGGSAGNTCPSGYIGVPGDSNLGSNFFCVMQVEARGDSMTAPHTTFSSNPWASITLTQARGACQGIPPTAAYPGSYDLISNLEWMTLARNIELTPANWSTGTVGQDMINRGHSDSVPSSALSIDNSSDPYNSTGNSTDFTQKRTHLLSTGETIWDLSGNVSEWVIWDQSTLSVPGSSKAYVSALNAPSSSWVEWNAVNVFTTLMTQTTVLPSFSNLGSTAGLGTYFAGTGTMSGAAVRGGSWTKQTNAGIYSLALDLSETGSNILTGFRCVYRP